MAPSPVDSPPESTGPPDRQTLRVLERRFDADPLIARTEYDPNAHEPRLLCAHFDDTRYPASIDAARLDARWFATVDFTIHYVETTAEESRWECRWDRHPNEHNARTHFHAPPNGDEVRDLSLSSLHPLDVSTTVLTAIDHRLERLWDADRE